MNKHLKNIGKIFLTILIFTVLDFIPHSIFSYLNVIQPEYSFGKIFYGTILAIIGYYIIEYTPLDKLRRYAKTSILTLFIILPLEIRYAFIYSYGWIWNIVVLSMHYVILAPTLYLIVFRKEKY